MNIKYARLSTNYRLSTFNSRTRQNLGPYERIRYELFSHFLFLYFSFVFFKLVFRQEQESCDERGGGGCAAPCFVFLA
jgi:hypothetical protein